MGCHRFVIWGSRCDTSPKIITYSQYNGTKNMIIQINFEKIILYITFYRKTILLGLSHDAGICGAIVKKCGNIRFKCRQGLGAFLFIQFLIFKNSKNRESFAFDRVWIALPDWLIFAWIFGKIDCLLWLVYDLGLTVI